MPDPHRIRHLLVYCNKRAYDVQLEDAAKKAKSKSREKDKSKDVPRSAEGDKIVGEIMDVFLSGLGKGDVETNVFDTTVCSLTPAGISLRCEPSWCTAKVQS
jgi:kinetochore protein Mis13/DSN1